jgi:hypothetical protein
VLPPSLASDDRAHVRRRPAHVERQGVLEAGEGGDPGGADDTGRRTGEQREGRVIGGLGQRRDSSGGAHDQRLGEAYVAALLGKRPKVPGEHRAEVGVDDRGGGPLVLPKLRRDLVRCDHVGGRISPS